MRICVGIYALLSLLLHISNHDIYALLSLLVHISNQNTIGIQCIKYIHHPTVRDFATVVADDTILPMKLYVVSDQAMSICTYHLI